MAQDIKKLLISKVKEHRQLYDKGHRLYKDRSSAKIWENIAQELDIPGKLFFLFLSHLLIDVHVYCKFCRK